jgi:hypothetical protein
MWGCAPWSGKIRVVAIRRATRLAPDDDAYLVGPYAELLEVLRHDRQETSTPPPQPSN